MRAKIVTRIMSVSQTAFFIALAASVACQIFSVPSPYRDIARWSFLGSVVFFLGFLLVVQLVFGSVMFSSSAEGMPAQPTGVWVSDAHTLEVGDPVLARWQGQWWRAEVVELAPGDQVIVRYTGWDAFWNETHDRNRLQLPPAEGAAPLMGHAVAPTGIWVPEDYDLEIGDAVLAEWRQSWWRAEVVELAPDRRVVVRYSGWDDDWNETHDRDRLQLLRPVDPPRAETGIRAVD